MKKLIIISILATAMLLTACASNEVSSGSRILEHEYSGIEINNVVKRHVDSIYINRETGELLTAFDLDTLLKSDIIVIGEFIEEVGSGFSYEYYEEIDEISRFFPCTFNRLLITEVLKGDIRAGETIIVTQSYAVDEYGGLVTMSELTPIAT